MSITKLANWQQLDFSEDMADKILTRYYSAQIQLTYQKQSASKRFTFLVNQTRLKEKITTMLESLSISATERQTGEQQTELIVSLDIS